VVPERNKECSFEREKNRKRWTRGMGGIIEGEKVQQQANGRTWPPWERFYSGGKCHTTIEGGKVGGTFKGKLIQKRGRREEGGEKG